MARQRTPCVECRKRRRKCTWHLNSIVCLRCSQRGIRCVPIDDLDSDSEDKRSEDGDQELGQYTTEIQQLRRSVQDLEATLRDIRYNNGNQLLSSPMTTTSNDNEPTWQLSVINGNLRLETPIKSMEELYQFSQASIRYLSPFHHLFLKKSFVFECNTSHILAETLHLTARIQMTRRSSTNASPLRLIQSPNNHINYGPIIDDLVNIYMRTPNCPLAPVIHIPTLRQYYNSLADPFSSPIIMGICVNVMSSSGSYTHLSAEERRQLADFFFEKCHDLLFDIFDDPTKRLDTLTTISLLYHYLTLVRLWLSEARRLATIAHLIVKDILSSGLDKELSNVERVMLQRQRMLSDYMLYHFTILIDGHTKSPFEVTPFSMHLHVLDDEDEAVKSSIRTINHVFRLCRSRYFLTIVEQIKNMSMDRKAEVNLHVFLRFETIMREWWATLPDDLRVCEDPYSVDAVNFAQTLDDQQNIAAFGMMHGITMMVHALLLSSQPSMETDGVTSDFLTILRKQALLNATRSCDILLALLKNSLFYLKDADPLSFVALGHIMYALSCISNCPEARIQQQTQANFDQIVKQLLSHLPVDHHIPSSISPIPTAIQTRQASPTLAIYDRYALPGYALLSDVMRISLDQLKSLFQCPP